MIVGLSHVGISVRNLDRAVAFYRDRLGMEVLIQQTFEGALYEKILALTGARGKVALLKNRSLQLELFEFEHPVPQALDPHRPVSDYGITHFCIEISDLDTEYQRLKGQGVFFHSEPVDFGVAKAVYARDPDGNVFELWEKTGLNDGANTAYQ